MHPIRQFTRRAVTAVSASALLAIAVALLGTTTSRAFTENPDLVISQVYGGGGNAGAPLTHDYIEIFNRSGSPVSLAGLSLQYASATGTGNFGANSGQLTELPDVVLQPGQYFLVQQAGGTNGVPLPTPDLVDPTPINMAAGAGKVALVTGPTSLGCNGGSNPCSAEQVARIIDLVGYGNANYFEGTAAAPVLSNTTAAFRAGEGCADTNDNVADFTAAAPAPRTTASVVNSCVPDTTLTMTISQVYGGGGNSGAPYTHDFIEIFNRGTTSVSLDGLSLQYASATGTGHFGASDTQLTALPNIALQPGQYFLVQQAGGATGVPLPAPDLVDPTPIAMAAGSGKVALVESPTSLGCNGGSAPCSAEQLERIIDLVGYGSANFFEGTGPAPTLSNTTAALRDGGGCFDTDDNAADFTRGSPTPRNTASPRNSCAAGPAPPTGAGAAFPANVVAGESVLLTVTVAPGTVPPSASYTVTGNLLAIGGPAAQAFFDDGTNGDVVAGDDVFSYRTTVAAGTMAGPIVLPVAIVDDLARIGQAQIPLSVVTLTRIHEIQGEGQYSPYLGQVVTTTGIVTARRFNNAFFIQTPDGEDDGNPNTSEGLMVFTGTPLPASPVEGDLVRVTGLVEEFVPGADPFQLPITELVNPTVTVLGSGYALPAPVTIAAADARPDGPVDQLERLEGMRVAIPSLTVVGPSLGSVNEATATATSTGIYYGVVTGTARPFREPGIDVLDLVPPEAPSPDTIPRFDGNPERIRVNSRGQVAAVVPVDVAAGQVVEGLEGVLDYAFRTYTLLPDVGTGVVSGTVAARPVPVARPDEITVASFNLERFFDTVNDPAIGEPILNPVAYENRLNKASLSIREVLRSPDVLGVVEVENLATLSDLARKINADTMAAGGADPAYVAYLEEGNDPGGIDVGFLVKSSRVTVHSVVQVGKDAVWVQPNGATALLNDRPPLVLEASVVSPASGHAVAFTVVVNHLRSLNGVTELTANGQRVRAKRLAQAEFLANLVQDRQAADPGARILVVGDLNAFQFSDGYADIVGAIAGTPAPADEVVLSSDPLVDPPLANLAGLLPPGERYSYVFDGSAQILDHVLVSWAALSNVTRFAYSRGNADFPQVARNDFTRPERLSDHDAPVAYLLVGQPLVSSRIVGTSIRAGHINLQLRNTSGAPAWQVRLDDVRFTTVAGTGAVELRRPTTPIDYGDLGVNDANTVPLFLAIDGGVATFVVTAVGSFVGPDGETYRFTVTETVAVR